MMMIDGYALILLFEGDDNARKLLAALIGRSDWRVRVAQDADAGYALLTDNPDIDVLVIDDAPISSGGLGGVDLVRRAKALRPKLKVLYTMGLARRVRDVVDADAVDRTPHIVDELIETICAILESVA